jgi:hypothetical protein
VSIEDKFSDLDYPGRRKPKNREESSKRKQPEKPVWDERPVRYMAGGEIKEFYLISHVAKALDCSVQSIRAWEDKGLLPRSPYRGPRTKKPVAGGRSTKGRRLWTREQVEAIVRIARRHRVILNKKPPTEAFARDVRVVFDKLIPQQ